MCVDIMCRYVDNIYLEVAVVVEQIRQVEEVHPGLARLLGHWGGAGGQEAQQIHTDTLNMEALKHCNTCL